MSGNIFSIFMHKSIESCIIRVCRAKRTLTKGTECTTQEGHDRHFYDTKNKQLHVAHLSFQCLIALFATIQY